MCESARTRGRAFCTFDPNPVMYSWRGVVAARRRLLAALHLQRAKNPYQHRRLVCRKVGWVGGRKPTVSVYAHQRTHTFRKDRHWCHGVYTMRARVATPQCAHSHFPSYAHTDTLLLCRQISLSPPLAYGGMQHTHSRLSLSLSLCHSLTVALSCVTLDLCSRLLLALFCFADDIERGGRSCHI